MKNKKAQKNLRHLRVKKHLNLKNGLFRLVVFRSNKHIYAQVIDDINSKTVASQSDLSQKENKKINKIEKAKEIGLSLAKICIKKDIKKIVFDRAGYKYHGRVKALAEGAREGGLVF